MSLAFYKYRLPFTKPLKTGKNIFSHREGIILEYTDEANVFYGESAPLPGFSEETPGEVVESLIEHKSRLASIFNTSSQIASLAELYRDYQLAPSLQFGLDALAYQIEARKENKNLVDYLFSNIHDPFPLNFLISNDCKDYISKIQTYVSNGYATLKFKVGTHFNREYKILENVRSHFPDLKIRLDANQCWGLDEAVEYCNKFLQLDIQYCEEPLRRGTPQKVTLLSKQTDLPLAMDETIYHSKDWPSLLPYTSFTILKPMVLGSFKTIFETKKHADAHDNKIVFTTSLESGIGRRITAILAAGLGSRRVAQGLSTGHLLKKDIFLDTAFISKGSYHTAKNLQKADINWAQLKTTG